MLENTAIATLPAFDVVKDEFSTTDNSLDKAIAILKSGETDIFSTFDGADFETQLDVVDAVTTAERLSDHPGTVIQLRNVVIQPIELTNDDGATVRVPRVILVDEDGTSYAAISNGILKSLQTLFGLVGFPADWPRALSVQMKEVRTRAGFRTMTISLVRPEKPVAAKK